MIDMSCRSFVITAIAAVACLAPTAALAAGQADFDALKDSVNQSSSEPQSFNTPLGTSTSIEAPGPPEGMMGKLTSDCVAAPHYPTSFTSSTSWEALVSRTHPFQSCPVVHEYHNGAAFKVDAITTHGQKICLYPRMHDIMGEQASTVWYHLTRGGWVWSGGTSRLDWNTTCT